MVSASVPMNSPAEVTVSAPVPQTGTGTANRWIQVGLCLTILFAYLLGDGRTPPNDDARQIYGVAESIVYRHTIRLPDGYGAVFASHPFLTSAIHVPATAVRWALARNDPDLDRILRPLASHFGGIVVATLGCLVFFRLLVHLGISPLTASLVSVVLAFGTFLPIYGRSPMSEAFQATAFIGFYSALLRIWQDPRRKTGLWLGFWAGMLVGSKYVLVLALPGALVFLGHKAWRDRRVRDYLRAGIWSLPTGVCFLAEILWYNWARTGTSTGTGYPAATALADTAFRENLLFGLWSQFFSLGKNVFFYNPPLVLAVVALPCVARTHKNCLWSLILTASPVLCLLGKFLYWSGDWCWGPRYLLFLVAPLLVLACLHLEERQPCKRRLLIAGWIGLFAIGAWVQVAGASQYWDHYIRVSKQIQSLWLGYPDRTGAQATDRKGECDPCFEDEYARTYTPAFQPIEAHAWYLWHHLKSDSWTVAAKDVPIRRYTTLNFAILRWWYENAQWDWWKLNFVGRHKATGNVLLAVFIIGLCAGSAIWIRGLCSPVALFGALGRLLARLRIIRHAPPRA
jgi:hypothetical protein